MKVLFISIFVISLVSIVIMPNVLGANVVPWGTIFVEKPVLELPYTAWDDASYEKMEIFGVVDKPRSSGFIYMTVTKPDGNTDKIKIRPSSDSGKYSNHILICCGNIGKYSVSAVWGIHFIGMVSFDVVQLPKLQPIETPAESATIPTWVKNTAGWWAKGQINDSAYISGIQYLIKEEIMVVPPTKTANYGYYSQEVPTWVKNTAGWWAKGQVNDSAYISGIQYLIEEGVIKVS